MPTLPKSDSRYDLECWIIRKPACRRIVGICGAGPVAADSVAEWVRAGSDPEKVLFRDAYAEGFGCKCPKTDGEQMTIGDD